MTSDSMSNNPRFEIKQCRLCNRGIQLDNKQIACGASVEDTPIWAQRKYGTGLGSLGCDSMDPDDGEKCLAFEARQ